MTNEYDQSKDLYKEYIWDEIRHGMPIDLLLIGRAYLIKKGYSERSQLAEKIGKYKKELYDILLGGALLEISQKLEEEHVPLKQINDLGDTVHNDHQVQLVEAYDALGFCASLILPISLVKLLGNEEPKLVEPTYACLCMQTNRTRLHNWHKWVKKAYRYLKIKYEKSGWSDGMSKKNFKFLRHSHLRYVKSRSLSMKLAEQEVNQAVEKSLENKLQQNSFENPFAMT